MKISRYFGEFVECHDGNLNKIIHLVGFALVGVGIVEKSLLFVLLGAVTQESGHFYQYLKTRKEKHSPLFCFKPQLFFAYPILLLIILYVVLTK